MGGAGIICEERSVRSGGGEGRAKGMRWEWREVERPKAQKSRG